MDNKYAMRKRSVVRVASAYLRKVASEEKKKAEIFAKIAPVYKSKLSDQTILWATAYKDKSHPNHEQAVKDYQSWTNKNTGNGLTQKMISKRGKIGKALSSYGNKLASKTWAGIKAVLKQGREEVKSMGRCPKILKEMATGEFSKKSKESRTEDIKALYGSAVYLGGVAVAVMSAGSAAPLLSAKTGAVALGKSLATHAVLGAISSKADFGGFLSLEAVETAAGFAGKSQELQDAMGGFASTDLFDGVVGAVKAGLDVIASEEEGGSEEDRLMVGFLGRVYASVGETMSTLTNEEMEKITTDAGLIG